jgi:hypothetical protein
VAGAAADVISVPCNPEPGAELALGNPLPDYAPIILVQLVQVAKSERMIVSAMPPELSRAGAVPGDLSKAAGVLALRGACQKRL